MSEDKNTYAVMAATGNIGRVVCEALLRAGAGVRVITRSAQKTGAYANRGAVPKVGAFDDAGFLAEAFTGADGVFALIPPDFSAGDYAAWQDRAGNAIASAIRRSGVKYAINLSSLGAHLPEGTGPIKGLYRQEQRLGVLRDVNIVHLRPTFFMENLYGAIPGIKAMGVLANSLRGDISMPMVATRDIGVKAAEFLLSPSFRGHSAFEFFGPRPYTMVEAATILGSAIGKPDLNYVQVTYEQAEQAMLGMGMNRDTVSLMIEMNRAFNEGSVVPTQPTSGPHAGPTSLEEFAKTWAQAYGRG